MVGDNIKKHPDEYRMVVEHGHRIGNHTFNHIRGFEYPTPDYLANAQKVDEIIHSDLFRPATRPHGFPTILYPPLSLPDHHVGPRDPRLQ